MNTNQGVQHKISKNEESTHGQTDLKKLENLITVDMSRIKKNWVFHGQGRGDKTKRSDQEDERHIVCGKERRKSCG